MAMHLLTGVYNPISRERCPGKQLLILDGHVSHINYTFQPLNVGLFGPLQHHYYKAVKDFFLTTSHGINRAIFFLIYKQA